MSLHAALGVSEAVDTPYPGSPWVVLKFGGRSVSTAPNWAVIAQLLRDRLAEGVRPVVVHSALVGVSNALIALLDTAVAGSDTDEKLRKIRAQHDALAKDLGVDPAILDERFQGLEQTIAGAKLVGEVSPRVHARVLAVGELAATELGAAYLRSQGLDARWLDIREHLECQTIREQTERARYLSARCDFSADKALQERFAAIDGFVVTQGFIARNAQGETVLLGRGGSDTTGAYLAGKLEARRLEIWTDAPGFFSADPKVVPSARLIKTLHYREAQEIASAGGGILHPRSISPVRASGIPLFLKCTQHPEWEGSVISNAPGDDAPQLKAISQRSGITLLSMESMEMWHQVGFLADAFNVFREHGLSVDLISTSESNVTVSIDVGANVTDRAAIEALARGPPQALQGHGDTGLRGDHAGRPPDPHDPARARARARGVPGAASPPRHAGRERPEPHVRRELGARVSARAARARPAREQIRGRRIRRNLGAVAGRRAGREVRAEAVVGQEEGAAARDRRRARCELRLRPREHRERDRFAQEPERGRRGVLRDEGEPESSRS